MKTACPRSESRMRRTLRKQKSAHALSIVSCSIAIVIFLTVTWKTYPQVSSSGDPFSAFLSLLWSEKLTFTSWLEIKLVYLVILADILLIFGVVLWVLSRQWLLVPGTTVRFQCPYCNKKWSAIRDKALVHCPHCNQLVHPKMTEK